jgi:hypothetical protein
VVVVEQLVDPRKRARQGRPALDPPAQLLGVLAADRHGSGRRPQRRGHNISGGGVGLGVAQERPGEQLEELGQQPLAPVLILDRLRHQGRRRTRG